MKVGPFLVMGVVVGISLWLALGTGGPSVPLAPGSYLLELIIGHRKVRVEQTPVPSPDGSIVYRYRFLDWDEEGNTQLSADEFQATLAQNGTSTSRNRLLRFFNVSEFGMLAWVGLGLGGQAVFAGRMVVQWLVSERKKRSVVPPLFWYMSLAGGLMLNIYFIWRHDVVGVLGQSTGLVIYLRNITLLGGRRVPADPEEKNQDRNS